MIPNAPLTFPSVSFLRVEEIPSVLSLTKIIKRTFNSLLWVHWFNCLERKTIILEAIAFKKNYQKGINGFIKKSIPVWCLTQKLYWQINSIRQSYHLPTTIMSPWFFPWNHDTRWYKRQTKWKHNQDDLPISFRHNLIHMIFKIGFHGTLSWNRGF